MKLHMCVECFLSFKIFETAFIITIEKRFIVIKSSVLFNESIAANIFLNVFQSIILKKRCSKSHLNYVTVCIKRYLMHSNYSKSSANKVRSIYARQSGNRTPDRIWLFVLFPSDSSRKHESVRSKGASKWINYS